MQPLKRVGATDIRPRHRASCHCGAVVLELDLPNGIVDPRRCDCSICGIYTHHQRRSSPDQFGFNVGCLEGVNSFDIEGVPTLNGVNHPADSRDLSS